MENYQALISFYFFIIIMGIVGSCIKAATERKNQKNLFLITIIMVILQSSLFYALIYVPFKGEYFTIWYLFFTIIIPLGLNLIAAQIGFEWQIIKSYFHQDWWL